jgi:opacity protein-like surface antigen
MIRSGTKLLAVAVAVLGTNPASAAEGWHGYASLGAGVAMNPSGLMESTGPSLQLYLGVETPIGLTLGATLEGLTAWGGKEPTVNGGLGRRTELSSRAVGLEARMRFNRDARISPWLGARVGYGFSESLAPGFQGSTQWNAHSSEGLSYALRFGLDWRLGEQWSLSTSGSAQWCDVRYFADYTEECAGPLYGFLVGPSFRF